MNYIKIDTEDVCNGNGLRVVTWLSGCNWHCYNCQNSQTWNENNGILFDELAKEKIFNELNKDYISGLTLTGGDPLHENNLNGVLDLVFEINHLYNETQDVVFEPQYIVSNESTDHNMLLKNSDKIPILSKQEKSKTIWLYTGYTWEEIMDYTTPFESVTDTPIDKISYNYNMFKRKQIIRQCDVLIDGRYVDSLRDVTLKWRGSSNQRVIDVQKSLQQNKIVLYCD